MEPMVDSLADDLLLLFLLALLTVVAVIGGLIIWDEYNHDPYPATSTSTTGNRNATLTSEIASAC